ncbi:hypothetical protein YQ44_21325 [Janthinobacterium sp. 1_2014MBL_MicDiv]|nr:hypothetical protein YQ44_21325 [Janthinobacterium sp. 1_2014MBL_MicDiv]
MLMYFFGALGALVAFFGFREWKAVIKPTKDKLERLETAHAGHIEEQKNKFDEIVRAHKNDLDAQMQAVKGDHQLQMQAVKTDHETQMQKMVEEFTSRMHRNAVALIASQLIWDVIDRSEREHISEAVKEDLYRDVVSRVDKVCGPGDDLMDGYLTAILLIRKAYVLKRLGEFAFAYETTVRALAVAGENPHVSWLYNAACYAALASLPDQCCEYLTKAVQVSAEMREDARTDSDFDSVKTLDAFIALVG